MNRILSSESLGASRVGGDASSWSQMVKNIELSKKTLPWNKEDFVPARRIPLPERKAKERELDPITMRLRDAGREDQYQEKKKDRTETKVLDRLNTIRDTEFNIINHTGPPRYYDKVVASIKENTDEPNRAFNLLSHLKHEKQTTCPLLWDDEYMNSHMPPRKGPVEVGGKPGREFNLISNQFSENHDAMLRADYDKMKHDMVKKYWETHDFNPLTGQYYSDEKEVQVSAKELQKKLTHGANNDLKLPQGYRYSEGNSYDILTLDVKDEEKILRAMSKEVRKDNRLSKFKGHSQKQVAAGMAAFDKAEKQHIARVGYERWAKEIDRGYDFVSTGPNLAATFKPLPEPKKTAWDKVQDSTFIDNYKATRENASRAGPGGNINAALASLSSVASFSAPASAPGTSDFEQVPLSKRLMGGVTSGTPRSNAVLNNNSSSGNRNFVPYSARSDSSANANGLAGGRAPQRTAVHVPVPALNLTRSSFSAAPAPAAAPASVRTGGLSAY